MAILQMRKLRLKEAKTLIGGPKASKSSGAMFQTQACLTPKPRFLLLLSKLP